MESASTDVQADTIKPPVTQVGVIGWAKANLFNGVLNSILTLITLYCLWKIVPPLIQWAFVDSLWMSSGKACSVQNALLILPFAGNRRSG